MSVSSRLLAWRLPVAIAVIAMGDTFALSSFAFAQAGLTAATSSRYVCNGNWAWRLSLRGPEGILAAVDHVIYELPSGKGTAPVRVDERGSPTHPFSTTGISIGSFPVRVSVILKDGRRNEFTHELRLVSPETSSPRPITVRNTAKAERKNWWKWTVFLRADQAVLDEVECVRYTLHPTFPKPIQERTAPRSGPYPFMLQSSGWGTFEVGVEVFLKDGTVQRLSHPLEF